ncbi:aa3-type cytochrome oxidase subunit II [Demequina lignilytica]|uniref:cytochrome-c oxidase n=1 Tax=Demequina lignilytica TaxID=3051663 RepID=A0AAW7M4U6_9MICO|nr:MULTISPECIES: cytochrome c oxidase subunit II [unclassified Demequina]MDN4482167.1 cytochrome c oxidase subunit II [Demequina sp. SYSU T0a273]MDN4486826.1 cytochrome c oxidase subunit II [Demequina sp. SYSU T00039]MDN4489510.1 cytochrome c oxidase subunit II [Demequina sp. SYSU T00068]
MSSISRPRALGKALAGALALGLTSLVAGCSTGIENGALPSTPEITNQTGRIITLWNGSWIAALTVGVITWGLILWAVIVYRKRKGDTKLPLQTRANVPLELMYTIVPLLMIGVLFKYTVEDISAIKDTSETPDIHINVVGKQWSWDFNYVDDDVYDPGVQASLTGEEGVEETLPTLYLPVGERVEFTLDSRDVIHSFWVPAFLYKEDVIPGRTNTFQIIPTQEGMYQGKCAELCGEYHASMLFNVAVVSRDEYDAHMEELRNEGYTGQIGVEEYSRDQVVQLTEEHEEADS